MTLSFRSRAVAAALPLLTVLFTASIVPSSSAGPVGESSRPGHEGVRATPIGDGAAAREAAAVELPRPARGRDAVRLLGSRLDEAAARNGMVAAELDELLRDDPTAWLATDGRLHYKEPLPQPGARTASVAEAVAPLEQTFRLHSDPDADLTIFLDVDGATVSDTEWHETYPTIPTEHPAWDPAGNGPTFTDAELVDVQTIWAAVAEDFAPFEVDVTTEDPGPAGILRSDASDTQYGSHALISPSAAWAVICNSTCGGVAYRDVFGKALGPGGNGYGRQQPAWVFPQGLGDSPKNIAEAASHEVGHNLSLQHDGYADVGYYVGHGAWAPIMGVGYYRPISQWSQGDYVGANNPEDDLALVGSRLGLQPDEAGGDVLGAPTLPVGSALIGSRTDVDTYRLGSCTGEVSVAAAVASVMPDLDVRLRLLDETGATVATSDPLSAFINAVEASGLSATTTRTVQPGTYYVAVDGAGRGTWTEGYDDYGSLGAYELQVTGECDGQYPVGVPSAPVDLTAAAHASEARVTLTWAPPVDSGAGPVTAYELSRDDGEPVQVAGDVTSHVWTGLEPGTTYTFRVAAVNAAGPGRPASVTATTAPAVVVPTAPQSLTATWDGVLQQAVVTWTAPASDGGGAITGYDVFYDGAHAGRVDGSTRAVALAGSFTRTGHVVSVSAVNSAGAGPRAAADLVVPPRPANDAFGSRSPLTGTGGVIGGDNTEASAESGEPAPAGSDLGAGGASVWYSWKAPASGPTTFRTGSDLPGRDTTLGVYTGSSLGDLSTVAVNDDTRLTRLSSVTFSATAGATYVITVDGFRAPRGVGPFSLTWTSPEPVVSKVASRTVLKAPRTAKAGSRPVIRVRVSRNDLPAAGKVVITYGKRSARRTLEDGATRLRLPRLAVGRLRIVAKYRGNATTEPSRARKKIRVKRSGGR